MDKKLKKSTAFHLQTDGQTEVSLQMKVVASTSSSPQEGKKDEHSK